MIENPGGRPPLASTPALWAPMYLYTSVPLKSLCGVCHLDMDTGARLPFEQSLTATFRLAALGSLGRARSRQQAAAAGQAREQAHARHAAARRPLTMRLGAAPSPLQLLMCCYLVTRPGVLSEQLAVVVVGDALSPSPPSLSTPTGRHRSCGAVPTIRRRPPSLRRPLRAQREPARQKTVGQPHQ